MSDQASEGDEGNSQISQRRNDEPVRHWPPSIPVSYTHLDVYKRQNPSSSFARFAKPISRYSNPSRPTSGSTTECTPSAARKQLSTSCACSRGTTSTTCGKSKAFSRSSLTLSRQPSSIRSAQSVFWKSMPRTSWIKTVRFETRPSESRRKTMFASIEFARSDWKQPLRWAGRIESGQTL